MSEIDKRRDYSSRRLDALRKGFGKAAKFATDKACVYATGSFGRREGSEHSDLDLFIAGKSEKIQRSDGSGIELTRKNLLSHLDEICIQSELIQVSRRLGFQDFSGDGRYLGRHSVYEFVSTLGTEQDDVTNTFTARLLLLLESCPLVGTSIYEEVIREVIGSYWRDYQDHQSNFMPAFLANDILRLWRTFCVNYEARTEREPDHKKAGGKLKNYKLKHSRLLTCYSALLYLLALYNSQGHVTPQNAFEMTQLTPTERLEWLRDREAIVAKKVIIKLLNQYEKFLEATHFKEDHLIDEFMDKEKSVKFLTAAREFGDSMFEALSLVGGGSSLHRMLVV